MPEQSWILSDLEAVSVPVRKHEATGVVILANSLCIRLLAATGGMSVTSRIHLRITVALGVQLDWSWSMRYSCLWTQEPFPLHTHTQS